MQLPELSDFTRRPSRPHLRLMPAAPSLPWIKEEAHSPLVDAALLLVRAGTGALLAGHGAQKLFGWFGGHGLQGTGKWMESMGLKPGTPWALAASAGELGGGMLMALGLGGPVGPIGVLSAMSMATAKVHWGKPIWNTEGGAELPVAYSTAAAAIALAGPGRYSLDHFFGIKMHWAIPAALAALAGAMVAYGAMRQPEPQPQQAQQPEQPEEQAPEQEAPEREPTPFPERRPAAA
jgi:putative oxidoreductase